MKNTPFLKNSLLFSTKDHPGYISTISFVDISNCNLACIDCHNMHSCKQNYDKHFYKREDFLENLENSVLLGTSEIFIISGGEPTLHTPKLVEELVEIKNRFPDLKIRIDTNGQRPKDVFQLKGYVDGFGVDIKIPIKEKYTPEEIERFRKILGIKFINQYKNKLLKTISIVDDMPFTVFRTVRYNYLTEEDINSIETFCKTLKCEHFWNNFTEFKE